MRHHDGIPDLKLIPTEKIRFHEHPESQRTDRLVSRLRADHALRNPPIVTGLSTGEWMLLDGANRVSGFRAIGWSHIPVQVIDYGSEEVQLKGWHHLLVEGKALDLRSQYAKIRGVELRQVTRPELASLLVLRKAYAVLVDDQLAAWALLPSSGHVALRPWMEVLEDVVAAYEGLTRLERIKVPDYENLPDVFRTVDHQLVLFPTLTKPELLELAYEGVLIPTGITRHLIPGRALGLNLPLGFLEEMSDERRKVEHFRAFVDGLEMAGRIRFYEESVFIMNE